MPGRLYDPPALGERLEVLRDRAPLGFLDIGVLVFARVEESVSDQSFQRARRPGDMLEYRLLARLDLLRERGKQGKKRLAFGNDALVMRSDPGGGRDLGDLAQRLPERRKT